MREITINRKTNETDIRLTLNLDGSGKCDIETDCGFLKHMLELFAHHGKFDLYIKCVGDSNVDFHHTTEDIGICLGRAFDKLLGDRKGICRYGYFVMPMDEALIVCAVDICGRTTCGYGLKIAAEKVGDFDTELTHEFLFALAREMKASIHANMLAGENSHHIIEATFKGLSRALKTAVTIDAQNPNSVPSTKGTLDN